MGSNILGVFGEMSEVITILVQQVSDGSFFSGMDNDVGRSGANKIVFMLNDEW